MTTAMTTFLLFGDLGGRTSGKVVGEIHGEKRVIFDELRHFTYGIGKGEARKPCR